MDGSHLGPPFHLPPREGPGRFLLSPTEVATLRPALLCCGWQLFFLLVPGQMPGRWVKTECKRRINAPPSHTPRIFLSLLSGQEGPAQARSTEGNARFREGSFGGGSGSTHRTERCPTAGALRTWTSASLQPERGDKDHRDRGRLCPETEINKRDQR